MYEDDAEIIDAESTSQGTALATVPGGGITQRLQTDYVTAMSVQLPRSLPAVQKRFVEESRMMGEAAYYGWGAGKNRIEGPSQALAYAAARCWGNCAVDQQPIEETSDAWIFTSVFIDCETGFTLTRKFRQSKRSVVHGKHDDERKDDMRFQIGQTKGDRNVVLKALPKWLIDKGMEEAKAGVREKLESYINKHGQPAAIDYAMKELKKSGITEERVCSKFSIAKLSALSLDSLVIVAGDIKAIQTGQEYPDTLYPADDTKDLADQIASAAKPDPKEVQPEPPFPEPSDEITPREEYLAYVAEADTADRLIGIEASAAISLSTGDQDIVTEAIRKREEYLSRGERSNDK